MNQRIWTGKQHTVATYWRWNERLKGWEKGSVLTRFRMFVSGDQPEGPPNTAGPFDACSEVDWT